MDVGGLRRHRASPEVLCALLVWMLYLVTRFRLPTDPITLSDDDDGSLMRQVIFGGTGLLAFLRFFSTGSLGSVLAVRRVDFGLAALLIGSLLWSVEPVLTFKRSLIFLFGLAALACVVHMTDRPVRLMQRTLVGFTGLVALASVVFWFVLPRDCVENPLRPGLAGIAEHPNTLAPFLALGFAVSFGMNEVGRGKLLLRVLQASQLTGLWLAESMTSLSMLLATLAAFFVLSSSSYLRGVAQLAGTLVAGAVFVAGPRLFGNRVLGWMGRDSSFSGRDELWDVLMIEAWKKPIFGHGYGAFWYEGRGRELVTTWNPRQAHNAYLDTLTELGIFGLCVVLFAFHARIASAWVRHRGAPGTPQRLAAASLVAIPAGLLTVYGFGQSFLFRLDSFPFFVCLWCTLLLANEDGNHLSREFAVYESTASQPDGAAGLDPAGVRGRTESRRSP